MSPYPNIKEPPWVADPVLRQWLLDIHHHVYGIGEDTKGVLDRDNIDASIPLTTEPTVVTGLWTFLNKVTIEQSDVVGNVPVVELRQNDTSEEFIKFIGAAISGNISQSLVKIADANIMAQTGWLKITIQDNNNQIAAGDYYLPFFKLT